MTISHRTFFLIAGLVLLAGVTVVLWWLVRPQKTDRQQILTLLQRAERSVEEQDIGALMRLISNDYSDGTYSKRSLRRMALAGFRNVGTIEVLLVLDRLEIHGQTARAELEVDVWMDSNRPQPTLHLSMWVELIHENRWLVTSAGGGWPLEAEQPSLYD